MKSTKARIAIVVSVISIIVILLCVALMFKNASKDNTPVDIGNNDQNGKTVLPGDDEKIYNSISGESTDSVKLFPDITHEQVKTMLGSVSLPSSFCWYYDNTIYSSKKSISTSGILKMEGSDYRIEIYSNKNVLNKTVISEGDGVTIQNNIDGTVSEFSKNSFDMFSEAGVPDISMFLSDDGFDFDYTLIDSEFGSLIFASFTSEKDGYSQKQEYYISLDYGIVVRADCYENDRIIYSLTTKALYELET